MLQVQLHQFETQKFWIADHCICGYSGFIHDIIIDHLYQIVNLLHSLVFMGRIRVNNSLCFALWPVREKFQIFNNFSNLITFIILHANKSSVFGHSALMILCLLALL